MNLAKFVKIAICSIVIVLLLRITINSLLNNFKKLDITNCNIKENIIEIQPRTFTIDFIGNVFVKDGKIFQYISGSVLYARIPELYWYDRLLKIKAAGLNTIQFYVPWNFHEYEEGQFNFVGNANLSKFLTIARQLDLLVLLRSGPYMCGEWDFGGLPAWLLRKNPNMILRSSAPDFLQAVLKWYSVLLPILKPHLYQNNGSIIMVQVENEYGSYYTCDDKYLRVLYDTVRSYLGDDVIIYSTDGNGYSYLPCGSSDRRIFTTVDFGASGGLNPASSFSGLREFQPRGPLVNSEYYSGWLDSWGRSHNSVDSDTVVKGLISLYNYSNSVNVNMYMFHGGTSFGFWNGANDPPYLPQITSYDYDAPLSEAGDTTDKYMAIRNCLENINPNKPFLPVPPNTTKVAYGLVAMEHNLDYLTYLLNQNALMYKYPVTMEYLSHYNGYMVYITETSGFISDYETGEIIFDRIGDYAYIFTSNSDNTEILFQGMLNRNMANLKLTINIDTNLIILIENSGHVNYGKGMLNDVKGIIGNVSLNGEILLNWKHIPINLTNLNSVYTGLTDHRIIAPSQFGLFSSILNLETNPQDSFLKTSNFSKGIVIINGFNVGRYWNTKGPQYTLFIPKTILKLGWNKIILLELEGAQCSDNCFIEFVNQPILDGPVHFTL